MGGLYVEFARQIAAHQFSMPAWIPYYTEGGIPFAYPPLPFYVEAALFKFFPHSEFTIANFLPPITAIASLFAFYILVHALRLKPLTGTIALAAFATLPSAYYEQLESAGLAEAFGSLAAILFSTALVNAVHHDKPIYYIVTGLALGFCILSSPASAYAGALLFVLVAATRLTGAKGQRFAILSRWSTAGLIGVLVASPYLLAVNRHHGIGLFWNVLSAQNAAPASDHPFPGWLAPIFDFNASGAPYPFIWDFMIFSGLVWAVLQRRWWLPLWFLTMLAIPREGWWMASIPASLLVGFSVTELWGPIVTTMWKDSSTLVRNILYLALAILFSAYVLVNLKAIVSQDVVKGYDRGYWVDTIEAAEWVKMSTPADARLIVTMERQAKEWIPHLTQREVLNVPYGAEWDLAEHQQILKLEDDLGDCSSLPCIRQAVEKFTPQLSWYGFLRKRGNQGLSDPEGVREAGFEMLWENREVVIVRFTGGAQP